MTDINSLAASLSLKGRVAVVTGSTSGIGLAIAESLGAAGCNLMINGFGAAEAIEAERSRLEKSYAITCLYSGADLSKGADAAGLIGETEQRLGAVDILVNNAGIQHVSPIEDFPPEKWDAILAINLSSAFHTIRAAVPGMKQRGWGRIVNIASAHGLVASPFKSAYVAAKHGILGLTKTVGLELAETAITCNAICPGYVKTPLVDAQIKDQAKVHNLSEADVVRDVILASQPNKRFVGTDELSALVLLLCSPLGASFTGAALPIDGGWTAR